MIATDPEPYDVTAARRILADPLGFMLPNQIGRALVARIDALEARLAALAARARAPDREVVARAICVSRTGVGCICEFQGNPPLCSKHLSAADAAIAAMKGETP